MIFGYYGTTSYGSFNNVHYTNFLTATEAIPPQSEHHTRWAIGVAGNFLLSIFAGEKYLVVEDAAPFLAAPQYELLGRYGKDHLLRNNLALPLGVLFANYIPEDVFRGLPRDAKEEVLTAVAILPSKAEGERLGLTEITIPDLQRERDRTPFPDIIAARRRNALTLTSFAQTRIEGTVNAEAKSVLIVQTPFDRGWRAWQDGKPAAVTKVDVGLLGIAVDVGPHQITLRYRNPRLTLALVITSLAALIGILAAWRWPRLTTPA